MVIRSVLVGPSAPTAYPVVTIKYVPSPDRAMGFDVNCPVYDTDRTNSTSGVKIDKR